MSDRRKRIAALLRPLQRVAVGAGILGVLLATGLALADGGHLDPTFNGTGKRVIGFPPPPPIDPPIPCDANDVAIQDDGKIVLAGQRYRGGGRGDFLVARYGKNGRLDSSFSGNGWLTTDFGGTDSAWSVAIGKDGKIVAAGSTQTGERDQVAVARYLAR